MDCHQCDQSSSNSLNLSQLQEMPSTHHGRKLLVSQQLDALMLHGNAPEAAEP